MTAPKLNKREWGENLFAYGSLISPQVFQAVVGEVLYGKPAILKEYGCYRLKGKLYPGIVSAKNEMTEGVLYEGLSLAHLKALDYFEGEMYQRVPVLVCVHEVTRYTAWVYELREDYYSFLSADTWHYEEFLESDLSLFINRYKDFAAFA